MKGIGHSRGKCEYSSDEEHFFLDIKKDLAWLAASLLVGRLFDNARSIDPPASGLGDMIPLRCKPPVSIFQISYRVAA